jgi:uncharacterized protein
MQRLMEEKKIFLQPPVWLPIAVALLVGGAYIAGKKIEVRGTPATISVAGEGKVFAVPDIASLSFGVQTGRMPTAQAAMEKLTKDMYSVIDAVKGVGIEQKDIQTEYLNLYPAYDWREGEQIPRGFEANQSLRVKVRDLDKVGAVLTAATQAGANQAGGVTFTIDDPEELKRQARGQAIVNAKEKAQVLSSDLGVSLGKLMAFNEGGASPMPPMYERAVMNMGMGGGGDSVPVPSGEQEIRVSVSLTYEVQ